MDADHEKTVVEIWKTVVAVQMHFNDIEMKVRGLFITIVLGLAAAQGFLSEKRLAIELGQVTILYAVFIPLLGTLATFLFYLMDKHWYHRLLVGAVNHAIKIEKQFEGELPELGLSASIGEASPYELKGWLTKRIADLVVSDKKYKPNRILHSDGKIDLFYKPIAILFLLAFFVTLFFAGIFVGDTSIGVVMFDKFEQLICSAHS